ncbi:MAG: Pr6Pr family membrane protein [Thermoleophilia bacterium]
MRVHRLHAVVRLAVAGAAVVAMTYQLASLHGRGIGSGNFFSFFTIQSNVLAVLALAAAALVPGPDRGWLFDVLRTAATLYIAITGVVFALLLAGLQEQLQTTIPWVDDIVHRVVPAAVVLDWLIDPPRHRIGWRTGLWWLAYPMAWFAYTLIRGSVVGWYPYPFVDVSHLGYGGVAWRAAALMVAFAVAALALVALSRVLRLGRRALGAVPGAD